MGRTIGLPFTDNGVLVQHVTANATLRLCYMYAKILVGSYSIAICEAVKAMWFLKRRTTECFSSVVFRGKAEEGTALCCTCVCQYVCCLNRPCKYCGVTSVWWWVQYMSMSAVYWNPVDVAILFHIIMYSAQITVLGIYCTWTFMGRCGLCKTIYAATCTSCFFKPRGQQLKSSLCFQNLYSLMFRPTFTIHLCNKKMLPNTIYR